MTAATFPTKTKGRWYMARTPIDVLQDFLLNAFNPDRLDDAVARLVADDATYVSLSYDDPDLARIMPWAGTKHGKEVFASNFRGVTTCWTNDAFEVRDTIEEGEKVVLFESFTLRSTVLNKSVTSAFAVFALVRDDKIRYFQYMGDTFATAPSFLDSGTWVFRADPHETEPVRIS
jgi:uncharacterized protein